MKLATNYLVRVLATGFVVLTLVTIPLFWLRTACRLSLLETMPDDLRNIAIEPSGYISPEIEKDPNLTQHSRISATLNVTPVTSLGLADYFLSRWPMGRRSDVYVAKSEEDWAFFDRASGQIICRYVDTEVMPDRSQLHRQVQYYVGPEGISEIPTSHSGDLSSRS